MDPLEPSKRAKVPVMSDSGQTYDERRALRISQRKLHDTLLSNPDLDLSVARAQNNSIFDKVRFTREAVLDGENHAIIARAAVNQVAKSCNTTGYDVREVLGALRKKCVRADETGKGVFDWGSLGVAVGTCFNSVGKGSAADGFFLGTLNQGKGGCGWETVTLSTHTHSPPPQPSPRKPVRPLPNENAPPKRAIPRTPLSCYIKRKIVVL
jgi:hypothetical protein